MAPEMATQSANLRAELKEWERAFADANGGRKAERSDIKKVPEIGMNNIFLFSSSHLSSNSPINPQFSRKIQRILPPKSPRDILIQHQDRQKPRPTRRTTQETQTHLSKRPFNFPHHINPPQSLQRRRGSIRNTLQIPPRRNLPPLRS